jgi:dimethylargininase
MKKAGTRALVRGLSASFPDCLKENAPSDPIRMDLARAQHEAYVRALRGLVDELTELPADDSLPDCCFIEDTAVVVGERAAISFLGARERRGEETAVRDALRASGVRELLDIREPATLDGGDVLYTGRHLFVGLSRRTNEAAARQLEEIFGDLVPVCPVRVQGTLHLKSVLSALDSGTLLFGDCDAAKKIHAELEARYRLSESYAVVWLPDPPASNVLAVGSSVLVQDGFPRSEVILKELARRTGKTLIPIRMSEFIKADGALTCCSILF